MDHLQEIKSRLSIEELVSSYVPLKRAGKNLKGLCPFHAEKTPSFIVSPDKEIAYCFGCNKGGDIFKFTQLMENCDFGEVVKMLAERTGVKLPRSIPQNQNKRMELLEIHQEAMRFFQHQLTEHPKAKEYFLRRGLSEATLEKFHLGYAPDSFTALKDHLLKKGYLETALIESGLLIQRSMADKSSYDRFRNRLMFPLFDHQGNPVGFGGRAMDGGEPKYLNSPETLIYQKSLLLYGLNFAKDAIKKEDRAIMVEGYMDAIAAHQAGTANLVATSGTALTPQQLKLLKRYTPRVAFAFDRDVAGQLATLRAIELAQIQEFDIGIIEVPEGKDPDECIQKNPEAWFKTAAEPVPAMDFYFNYARRQFDPATLPGKKGMLGLLLPLIKQYSSEMEQGVYLDRLSLELKTDTKLLWNDLKKTKTAPTFLGPSPVESPLPDKKIFGREAYLLGFIFQFPHFYSIVHEGLIDNIPFDSETRAFYNVCKAVYEQEGGLKVDEIKNRLEPEASEALEIFRLLVEEHYPDFSEEAAEREIRNLIRSVNRANLYKAQKEVEFKIRGSKETDDRNLLLNEYNEILKLSSKL
ncbi:MAG: DNA primase [Candidatus Peregrinibacteria bacterium]